METKEFLLKNLDKVEEGLNEIVKEFDNDSARVMLEENSVIAIKHYKELLSNIRETKDNIKNIKEYNIENYQVIFNKNEDKIIIENPETKMTEAVLSFNEVESLNNVNFNNIEVGVINISKNLFDKIYTKYKNKIKNNIITGETENGVCYTIDPAEEEVSIVQYNREYIRTFEEMKELKMRSRYSNDYIKDKGLLLDIEDVNEIYKVYSFTLIKI